MEPLSIQDMQNLNEGIQKLYTLDTMDPFGMNALSIVDRLVPGDVPEFHVTSLRTHQVSSTFLPDVPGFTPEMERVMQQHFGEHPVACHMPQTLDGVYKISDFISRQELHGLEGLYQQFLRLLDTEDQMLFFLQNAKAMSWQNFLQTDTSLVGFSTHRKWGCFTERDRTVLNLLRPHLFQAHSNARKYHQSQQKLNQFQQSVNCINLVILDTEGRIQSIAPQAAIWLETYFPTSISSLQLPDHLWSWVKYQVNYLTKNSDLPGACLPLRIQQAGRELIIRLVIEQSGQRYLLLLEEQSLSLFASLELLGLSPRETEILAWMMQGKNNQEIAVQLNINIGTVRKHLENIYGKFGVHSRTEAISQALTKLGLLHSLPLS